MATEIYKNIVSYQAGDSSAAWALVQKFEPLLKHYAFALYREDAFEDLQCYRCCWIVGRVAWMAWVAYVAVCRGHAVGLDNRYRTGF